MQHITLVRIITVECCGLWLNIYKLKRLIYNLNPVIFNEETVLTDIYCSTWPIFRVYFMSKDTQTVGLQFSLNPF